MGWTLGASSSVAHDLQRSVLTGWWEAAIVRAVEIHKLERIPSLMDEF